MATAEEEAEEAELNKMMLLSQLLPELNKAMTEPPQFTQPIDMTLYPEYMQGITPNPDLFVFQRPSNYHYQFHESVVTASAQLYQWHAEPVTPTASTSPSEYASPHKLLKDLSDVFLTGQTDDNQSKLII